MGTRFQRRFKIAPGIRVNIGKSGISGLSFGPRGASVSVGKHGAYGNLGTPVPGLSVRKRLDSPKRSQGTRQGRAPASEKAILLEEWDGVAVSPALDQDGLLMFATPEGQQAPDVVAKRMHKQNAEAVAGWLAETAEELNAERQAIVRLHLRTPVEPLQYVPREFDQKAPLPTVVCPPVLPAEAATGCLGLLHLLMGGMKAAWQEQHDIEVAELMALHESEVGAAEAQSASARAAWEGAKKEFEDAEAKRKWLWVEGRMQDMAAMGDFLEEELGRIMWPRETLIDFEFVGDVLWLDVDLPEIEDMPDEEAIVRGGAKGIRFKRHTATALRRDYMTHVHAIGVLLCGVVYTALPVVREVVLSGYSQRTNKANGRIEDEYLYSVRVTREGWDQIDVEHLDRVDPVEALALFDLRRKMTKTGIFKPIEPFARS